MNTEKDKLMSDLKIDNKTSVSEMVRADYRTASVFKKYGVEYCCGGKWPLESVCMMNGIELTDLLKDLKTATRNVTIPSTVVYKEWNPDFLIDYIINVHHNYLKTTLPQTDELLQIFLEKHLTKYPYLTVLTEKFNKAKKRLSESMDREEEVIFPYIRQIAHAQERKESYAALLVKTLRKSFRDMIRKEDEKITDIIASIRLITDDYALPEKACVSHHVNLSMLKELDNDITQHIFLEESVLFPKAAQIEKELLQLP